MTTITCLDCGQPAVSWRCYACAEKLAASLGDGRAAFEQTMADAREHHPDWDFDGSKRKERIELEWQQWKAAKGAKKSTKAQEETP